MKKIKRHLSFTLRQREHDDVLVKKDAISPLFKKSQGKHDFSEQFLIHENEGNLTNQDCLYSLSKENKNTVNEPPHNKFSLSPSFTSFIRRTSSNSRLLSPQLSKTKQNGSATKVGPKILPEEKNNYSNPGYKDDCVKLRGSSYNGSVLSKTGSGGDSACHLKKSNSVKYPNNAKRQTTLQRSLSVGAAARKAGYSFDRSKSYQSEPDDGFGKIESYTRLEKLGEGTYAHVYKGRSNITGMLVALKETSLEHEEGVPCTAIREVSLLKDLKHSNIVTLHDLIITQTKSITLIFEYVERDLKQYMDACHGNICIHNIKLFVYQLLRGLEYCHSRKVLHRDLKPQNLLISERGEVKLADFGLARAKSVPTKTFSHEVCTMWYRPPDVLLGSTEYSTPIDMWGVGCILHEMCSGRALFPGSTVEEQLYFIFKTKGLPTETTWPGVHKIPDFIAGDWPTSEGKPIDQLGPKLCNDGVDLLDQLLKYPPRWRITAKNGLSHAWFSTLPPVIHTARPEVSIFSYPEVYLQPDDLLLDSPLSKNRSSIKDKKGRRPKNSTTV